LNLKVDAAIHANLSGKHMLAAGGVS